MDTPAPATPDSAELAEKLVALHGADGEFRQLVAHSAPRLDALLAHESARRQALISGLLGALALLGALLSHRWARDLFAGGVVASALPVLRWARSAALLRRRGLR